ncbi:phage protein Gp27 family protein [Meiothermus sp.]|uniref:phage protein Gp27 family protein n=1 Tax=Meiothermus sp. TaxID=1955249 RepID=UPI00307D3624
MAIYVQSTRCKVCQSPLRDEIDQMLLGDIRRPDGSPYRIEDIVSWAAARGEQLSAGGLSRHRTTHLLPALGAALEAQQVMEVIGRSTGKQLSLQTAFTNVLIHKLLRFLETFDPEEIDARAVGKILETGVKAVQASLQLEKAERIFNKGQAAIVADKIEHKLAAKNLDPEVLATIRQEIYGLSK